MRVNSAPSLATSADQTLPPMRAHRLYPHYQRQPGEMSLRADKAEQQEARGLEAVSLSMEVGGGEVWEIEGGFAKHSKREAQKTGTGLESLPALGNCLSLRPI